MNGNFLIFTVVEDSVTSEIMGLTRQWVVYM